MNEKQIFENRIKEKFSDNNYYCNSCNSYFIDTIIFENNELCELCLSKQFTSKYKLLFNIDCLSEKRNKHKNKKLDGVYIPKKLTKSLKRRRYPIWSYILLIISILLFFSLNLLSIWILYSS